MLQEVSFGCLFFFLDNNNGMRIFKQIHAVKQLNRTQTVLPSVPPKQRQRIVVPSSFALPPSALVTEEEDSIYTEISHALMQGVTHDNYVSVLQCISSLLHKGTLPTIVPLLPLIFNLNKNPYSLASHFQFEPLFSGRLPANMTWVTGRQTGKSMNSAAQSIAFGLLLPGIKILHLTPLYSQIHRFSVNYIKPFLEYSPIKSSLINAQCTAAINQRNLVNDSVLYFTFAFKDLLRTRGYDAYWVKYDEAQDFDPDFIPIINQTTSGAPGNLRMIFKTGTPKTLENNLQKSLDRSSWAEWHVQCPHCGHWNVPSLDGDLDAMIGPRTPKYLISREHPGVVCAGMSKGNKKVRCGKPLDVRKGLWVHRYNDRKWDHAGYHVPQIILPQHCEQDHAWRELLAHREGANNMTQPQFYNEICGCSYDVGARPISLTELRAACVLPTETTKPREAARYVRQCIEDGTYSDVVLAIDWGGGGVNEISFTVVAVVAHRYDNTIEVPFAYRSLTPHLQLKEAQYILVLKNLFNASKIVHDGCGNGPAREAQLIQLNVNPASLVRMNYIRIGAGALMKFHNFNPSTKEPSHWNLDKARSLSWLCEYIKNGFVKFFQYDTVDGAKPGLIDDFLTLVEDKTRTELGADVYSIIRDKKSDEPDDFTAAVNYGCCYFWGVVAKEWPQWASIVQRSHITEISEELFNELERYDAAEVDRIAGMIW
jgi:hypothetical protein